MTTTRWVGDEGWTPEAPACPGCGATVTMFEPHDCRVKPLEVERMIEVALKAQRAMVASVLHHVADAEDWRAALRLAADGLSEEG
jgi:hypothetical protein